jgi:ubiquinone/menaquinone biosynthesis C-methylase UbiE
MDPVLEKIKQFSDDQYSSDNRLEARIQLYRFCEHKTNLHHWIFDNLDFNNVTDVLELGCGNGTLWKENISKIPEDISIMLTDISNGMVDAARNTLSDSRGKFQFKVLDACRTRFHDASFQMIIANHMLYHIDDIH